MTSYLVEHEIRCEDIRPIVEEYLAGELDMKIHTAIENHLVVCPHCQDEIDIALGLEEVLQALPKPQPPPEIFDHVVAYAKTAPFLFPYCSGFDESSLWVQSRER